MKITVLGAGSIGKRHLKTLVNLDHDLEGIKEVRAFDLDETRRNQAGEEFSGVTICDTLKESVEGVDLVLICVPTSYHISVYNEINQYGPFHLFIEKPLSHTLEGCDNLIFNQKRSNKYTMLGYVMRLHPVLLKAKEYIEAGKVGNVLSVRAESGFYLPFWHPWEDYRDFYMSWKVGGGGALLDTSHEIDYLTWMFGKIKYAQGYSLTISDLDITSDDYTSCIFEFENGVMGELHLDLLQPDESRYLKVVGSKGVLIADLMKKIIKFNTIDDTKWIEEKIDVNSDEMYKKEILNVLSCINGKENQAVDVSEAEHVMQVIEAMRKSSSLGSRVRLPLYA